MMQKMEEWTERNRAETQRKKQKMKKTRRTIRMWQKELKEQEVLGTTNRLPSLIRHGPH
jgi:hypothetical protein